MAGGGAFVDAGVFEDLHEDSADLLLQDLLGILRREGIAALQCLGPVGVLLQRLVRAQVAAREDRVLQKRQLLVQPRGQGVSTPLNLLHL